MFYVVFQYRKKYSQHISFSFFIAAKDFETFIKIVCHQLVKQLDGGNIHSTIIGTNKKIKENNSQNLPDNKVASIALILILQTHAYVHFPRAYAYSHFLK